MPPQTLPNPIDVDVRLCVKCHCKSLSAYGALIMCGTKSCNNRGLDLLAMSYVATVTGIPVAKAQGRSAD